MQPPAGAIHVLIFVSVDCPIANAYAPEIQSIVKDYEGEAVRFFLVHADPLSSPELIAEHAQSYGYRIPIIRDPSHALVAQTGVSVTPEAVVLHSNGSTLYRGRIDDLYPTLGRRRWEPSQRDLRNAIDAALRGEPVWPECTTPIGCYIPARL